MTNRTEVTPRDMLDEYFELREWDGVDRKLNTDQSLLMWAISEAARRNEAYRLAQTIISI